MVCRFVGLLALGVMTVGCFNEPDPGSDGTGGDSTSAASSSGEGPMSGTTQIGSGSATGSGSTTGSGITTTGSGTADSSTSGAVCQVLERPGELADVDVVMAIDTSPAMAAEAADIQQELAALATVFPLNQFFRFIFVAPLEDENVQFCMPPPLGLNGQCNGNNLPHYRRLDLDTSQPLQDPLGVTVAELESNSSGTRLGSQKHLVVITDQDLSTTSGVLEAAVRGLGPGWGNARVHGISGGGAGCLPSPELEALTELTNGLHTELCPLDASSIWQAISTPLAECSFDVTGIDQAAVDDVVLFAGDVETQLQRVEDLRACTDGGFESTLIATDGGERLVLCPEACAAYQFASLQEMGGLRVTVCE